MPVSKTVKFVVPKSPAKAGDLLYQLRERRYALNKEAAALEKQESALKDFLINTLPISDASGITGAIAHIQIELTEQPQIVDKMKFQAYIKKTGRFDLITGSPAAAAIREMWEAKKTIPGIGKYTAKKVSCTKK
jgi:hypothetical protein